LPSADDTSLTPQKSKIAVSKNTAVFFFDEFITILIAKGVPICLNAIKSAANSPLQTKNEPVCQKN